MGEIADMMLEGYLCAGCGVTLPGESNGFPRYCRDCRREAKLDAIVAKKTKCPICSRMVKATGLADHTRALHQAALKETLK